VTDPEPGTPLKPWQWMELWALVLVIVLQLWLYTVSVVAGATWGLLVPALLLHMYFWVVPLLGEQRSQGLSEDQG
jgi:hypothetical protein